MTEKRPDWHTSDYYSKYNYETKKEEILHDFPPRCPFCGNEMSFILVTGYETHSSDSYWICPSCSLTIGNRSDFSEEYLTKARKRWRQELERIMNESKERYERTKKLYNQYGRYFTAEEKRDRLIETIEEHKPEREIE